MSLASKSSSEPNATFQTTLPGTSAEHTLLTYWGHSSFRPGQSDIITSCLSGRDVFVQQSTGFGKSVCFQIPALVSGKTAVVISPLISLMEDQVRALKLRGIRACFLGSAQTDFSVESRAIAGEYQVVYLSPEKVDTWQHGLRALVQTGVCVFAIDEAHCISQWGHDFRNAYTRLSVLRDLFPHIPIMALTATATERVSRDIVDSLHLVNPYIAKGSVNRANLFYSVRMKTALQQDLTADIIGDQSCIVYCLTKQLTEDVAAVISKFNASVAVYHAGLPLAQRSLVHRQFLTDEVQVVCATIAFGMGIDKPDIRRVIHYGAPKSLEGYMQETGRAGRDGEPSHCLLFWNAADFVTLSFISRSSNQSASSDQNSITPVRSYLNSSSCRRQQLALHFGEVFPDQNSNCHFCDNCQIAPDTKNYPDLKAESVALLKSCLHLRDSKFGYSRIVQHAHENNDVLKKVSRSFSTSLWRALELHKLIRSVPVFGVTRTPYSTFVPTDAGLKYITMPHPITWTPEMKSSQNKGSSDRNKVASVSPLLDFDEQQLELFESLKQLRLGLAKADHVSPFIIFPNRAAYDMIAKLPRDSQTLLTCSGIGQVLCNRYGNQILEVVKQHLLKYNLAGNVINPSLPVTPNSTKMLDPDAVLLFGDKVNISKRKQEIVDLFASGKSITQIAAQCEIAPATVQGYLAEGILSGAHIDFHRLDLLPETESIILSCLQVMGGQKVLTHRISEVKSQLPDTISYGEIKLCAAKHYSLFSSTHDSKSIKEDSKVLKAATASFVSSPSIFQSSACAAAASPMQRNSGYVAIPTAAALKRRAEAMESPSKVAAIGLPLIKCKSEAPPTSATASVLTAEQLARMEQTRLLALKRRAEVLAAKNPNT